MLLSCDLLLFYLGDILTVALYSVTLILFGYLGLPCCWYMEEVRLNRGSFKWFRGDCRAEPEPDRLLLFIESSLWTKPHSIIQCKGRGEEENGLILSSFSGFLSSSSSWPLFLAPPEL